MSLQAFATVEESLKYGLSMKAASLLNLKTQSSIFKKSKSWK
jgi:hypothetical protein